MHRLWRRDCCAAYGSGGRGRALRGRRQPLALLASLLVGAAWMPGLLARAAQEAPELATLEVRQGVVEWSPLGAPGWEAPASGQAVQVGDRIRTDSRGSVRLVFQDGSTTTASPNAGVRIDQLEQAKGGGLHVRLFHAAGATLHRVPGAADAGGTFAVETPAATVWVRGNVAVVEWPSIEGCRQRFVIQNVSPGGADAVEVRGFGNQQFVPHGQQTVACVGRGPGPAEPIQGPSRTPSGPFAPPQTPSPVQ
jgi:hypothetical protein